MVKDFPKSTHRLAVSLCKSLTHMYVYGNGQRPSRDQLNFSCCPHVNLISTIERLYAGSKAHAADDDVMIRDKHPELAREYEEYKKMLLRSTDSSTTVDAHASVGDPSLKQLLERMPEHIEFACA